MPNHRQLKLAPVFVQAMLRSPYWKDQDGRRHLFLLDFLEELGVWDCLHLQDHILVNILYSLNELVCTADTVEASGSKNICLVCCYKQIYNQSKFIKNWVKNWNRNSRTSYVPRGHLYFNLFVSKKMLSSTTTYITSLLLNTGNDQNTNTKIKYRNGIETSAQTTTKTNAMSLKMTLPCNMEWDSSSLHSTFSVIYNIDRLKPMSYSFCIIWCLWI